MVCVCERERGRERGREGEMEVRDATSFRTGFWEKLPGQSTKYWEEISQAKTERRKQSSYLYRSKINSAICPY